MCGSYIATLTAFATVNARYLPDHRFMVDIAAWTLPRNSANFRLVHVFCDLNKLDLNTD